MAFPTIISTDEHSININTTIQYPNAIAGDIIVAIVSFKFEPTYIATGWNVETILVTVSAFDDGGSSFWKVAEGNSNDEFTIQTGTNIKLVTATIRGAERFSWSGRQKSFAGDQIPKSPIVTNGVTNDYLYIIGVGTATDARAIPSPPSGYTNYRKNGGPGVGSLNSGIAFKTSTDLSNNGPVEWTYQATLPNNADDDWTGWSGVFRIPKKITIGAENSLIVTIDGDDLKDNLIIKA